MSDLLPRRLAQLGEPANLSLLAQCLHGIERECLRVDGDGQLALTPHPTALGSALTHPQIIHDQSQSLLEVITLWLELGMVYCILGDGVEMGKFQNFSL